MVALLRLLCVSVDYKKNNSWAIFYYFEKFKGNCAVIIFKWLFHQILLNLGICEVKSQEVLKNIKWEKAVIKGCILKDLFVRNAQKKHIS